MKASIEEQKFAIGYNISNVFNGLLLSLIQEMEKNGEVSGINDLIHIIADSSDYAGPEDEEYPVWDNKNPRAIKIIKRLEEALSTHGIKANKNILMT